MTITKGDKMYIITDKGAQWSITRDLGGVKVEYSIEKDLAPDAKALETYILNNHELF